jgi:hypothetical protein
VACEESFQAPVVVVFVLEMKFVLEVVEFALFLLVVVVFVLGMVKFVLEVVEVVLWFLVLVVVVYVLGMVMV